MAKRVFVNYYFRTKYGQGAKATAYFEEIRKEALMHSVANGATVLNMQSAAPIGLLSGRR